MNFKPSLIDSTCATRVYVNDFRKFSVEQKWSERKRETFWKTMQVCLAILGLLQKEGFSYSVSDSSSDCHFISSFIRSISRHIGAHSSSEVYIYPEESWFGESNFSLPQLLRPFDAFCHLKMNRKKVSCLLAFLED